MIALALAALLGVAATDPPMDLDARLAGSSAQAEALQGPMDGTWILHDAHGETLYVLQISDPSGDQGPLEGAWRKPGAGAPAGVVQAMTRQGRDLRIAFVEDDATVTLSLVRRGPRAWGGRLQRGSAGLSVTLDRVLGETNGR